MAVWQVEFAIVPRRALEAQPGIAGAPLMDADWWSGERLPPGYSQQLAGIAPLGTSTAKELQTWGQTDGNRVDVWLENGTPARMSARVDVRHLDARFGAMLLQFVKNSGAVLVRRGGVVVEPRAGDFGAALRSSDAWRHAPDSAAFFAP